jgi:hypothetical protein
VKNNKNDIWQLLIWAAICLAAVIVLSVIAAYTANGTDSLKSDLFLDDLLHPRIVVSSEEENIEDEYSDQTGSVEFGFGV